MPKLRHKWTRDKDFEPSQGRYSRYTCDRCKCEVFKASYVIRDKRFFDENIYREGRPFVYLPSCINWESDLLDE